MADALNQPQPEPRPGGGWIDSLTRSRRRAAIVLFVVAALLALIPLWMGIKYKSEYLSVCIWGGTLALLSLGAGLWNFVQAAAPEGQKAGADATRKMVLTVGGLAGLVTAVLGLVLAYQWWAFFAEGLEGWRKEWWRVWLCVLALVGGLAAMFASFQLARSEERQHAGLRRLLYGYNAVLTGLLLLLILVVVNVLPYVPLWPFTYLGRSYDWTESSLYTLSSGSKGLLEHLKKPLKVYVFLPRGDFRVLYEVKNLIDNCRAVTDKLDVEYLSPDEDLETTLQLYNKYHIPLTERAGVLVVYGTSAQEESEFIPYADLMTPPDRFGRVEKRFQFKGEDALMKKISYLEEGKKKAVVYFTQGNGEFDLNSFDPAGPGPGLGLLKEHLEKMNYEVKELKFGPRVDKVPEDATLVVIARPADKFPPSAVKALEDYMNPPPDGPKKGKLVVLLDVVRTPQGTMQETGLEKLLEGFGVQPGNERILALGLNPPGAVAVEPSLQGGNAIANSLSAGPGRYYRVQFDGVRPVRPRPGNPPGSRYSAETALVASAEYGIWAEKDLKADPAALVTKYRKASRQEILNLTSEESIPVAVTVSEPAASLPTGDPHDFMRQPEQQPRLAVFGAATWVANRELSRGPGRVNFQLFAGTLSWLRERPTGPTFADPKERSLYTLSSASPGAVSRLVWLPALLLVIGIVGLGGGIWFVRRR
jgi:hypothetical protein